MLGEITAKVAQSDSYAVGIWVNRIFLG